MSKGQGAGQTHYRTLEMVFNHGPIPERRDAVVKAMEECRAFVDAGVPVKGPGGAWSAFVTHSWVGVPEIEELFAYYVRHGYIDMLDATVAAVRLEAAILLENPGAFEALLAAGADERLVLAVNGGKTVQNSPDEEPIVVRDIEHLIELECQDASKATQMLAILNAHRMQVRITVAPCPDGSASKRRARVDL